MLGIYKSGSLELILLFLDHFCGIIILGLSKLCNRLLVSSQHGHFGTLCSRFIEREHCFSCFLAFHITIDCLKPFRNDALALEGLPFLLHSSHLVDISDIPGLGFGLVKIFEDGFPRLIDHLSINLLRVGEFFGDRIISPPSVVGDEEQDDRRHEKLRFHVRAPW